MTLVRDSWVVFGRYMQIFLRNPVWVIIGVIQPIFYLVLFAPLLESLAKSPGFPPGGAYNVFVPGLLIQLGLFGASGVGFGLIAELRSGVIERLRVTPVSRFALLLGRTLRDILIMLVQALILILLALPFGLSIHPLGIVLMLGLLALLGLMMTPVSYAVALWLGSEDAFAPLIFTATLPLLLLSGVLLPLSFAPRLAARYRRRQPPGLRRRRVAGHLQRPPLRSQHRHRRGDHGRAGSNRSLICS